MTRKEYNGYTNYETWLTALWIDNDQFLQETVSREARHAKDAASLSSTIEALVVGDEDFLPTSSGLMNDLLNAAISEIDFDSLAHHYLDMEEEEQKHENGTCDCSISHGAQS